MKIDSLEAAIDCFQETSARRPERDVHAAEEAALAGERRRYPVMSIQHLSRPDDLFIPEGEFELPEVAAPDGPEGDLAREVISLLEPLKMDNPIRPQLGVGKGTGTLVPSFGIPLDPELGNQPAFTRTLHEVLADPPPDPATSGLLPEIRDRVEYLKDKMPPAFKINRPDMQGPYNIAHAIIGEEALVAPYTDAAGFAALMERITDFWIQAVKNLNAWIGPDRLPPWCQLTRICECSVNLVSARTYEEHILPQDLRIARELGPVDVHTCSGPHVFHSTLESIPNVASTEAGFIECATAGWTPVAEAMEAIGERPIVLRIGQELPPGQEWETIRRDLDLYEHASRLLFGYTGMGWGKADRPQIRALHERADEYWENGTAD